MTLVLACLGTGLFFAATGCGDKAADPSPLPPPKAPPRLPQVSAALEGYNGFDVSDSLVPKEKIESGGPPRDGIPSIDNPKFVSAAEADFLLAEDLVMSVSLAGETRAYANRILNLHEIVNDQIGTNAFVVTYCPLCGTGMFFDRNDDGRLLDFGVSGLLYQSDVLMYDRQTESLWSQLKMQAVAGKKKGRKLRQLPIEQMTFAAWRAKYPQGKVLSDDTGHRRYYGRNPYAGYERQPRPMFDVGEIRTELPNKTWVIGLLVDGKAFAIPLDRLPPGEPQLLELAGKKFTVSYDSKKRHPKVNDATGASYPFTMAYWFAWQAFNRDTELVPKG